MYADFEYYTQEYLGTRIKEEDFPRLALRAGEYLDRVTFHRIAALHPAPQEVKKACCAVAELELRLESQEEGKSSETVGSYSVHWEPGRGKPYPPPDTRRRRSIWAKPGCVGRGWRQDRNGD